MLIRFSVENHLSIHKRQELSLVASSLKDRQDGLIPCDAVPTGKLLPLAAIYGANASGKTNIIRAITYFVDAVTLSHSSGRPDGPVRRYPFALDETAASAPSVFEMDFLVDGIRFTYGFEVTDRFFTKEWLFNYPVGKPRGLFARHSENKGDITFGKTLRGNNRIIADIVRPNSLFLAAAAQNAHDELTPVANYIAGIIGETSIHVSPPEVLSNYSDKELDSRVIAFLGGINTGIVSASREAVPEDPRMTEFGKKFAELFKEMSGAEDDVEFGNFQNIRLGHRNTEGDAILFDLARESSGTRRLLVLLGKAFDALDNGRVLVIDEIDASLHTKVAEDIVGLFGSSETNTTGAQLIFTTHDTNLLRSGNLRRDEIWFTEKDDTGATLLYPLTDIRTRSDDNIEKGYLQGRYGAIPFSGSSRIIKNRA